MGKKKKVKGGRGEGRAVHGGLLSDGHLIYLQTLAGAG